MTARLKAANARLREAKQAHKDAKAGKEEEVVGGGGGEGGRWVEVEAAAAAPHGSCRGS